MYRQNPSLSLLISRERLMIIPYYYIILTYYSTVVSLDQNVSEGN